MPNNAYKRGRKLEWDTAKLFKATGQFDTIRASGSHGLADLVVFRKSDDALGLTKPITISDIDQVLDGWMVIPDRTLILDQFLYGRRKYLPRGAEHTLHLTPAQCWLIQAKTVQPKKTKKKGK